jgi:hypothetical protein
MKPTTHFATQKYSKPREPRFERNLGDYSEDFNERLGTAAVQPYPHRMPRAVSSRPGGNAFLQKAGSYAFDTPAGKPSEGSLFPQNALAGYSDGEASRALYKEQYKVYARRELQSSLSTSQKRRSKRARLEESRKEAEELKAESMAYLMRQTRVYMIPNEVAMKQRY